MANLVDNSGAPLIGTAVGFAIALAMTFALWYASEKTPSIHSIRTTRREAWFWLAILFTFALGAAAGDLVAEKFWRPGTVLTCDHPPQFVARSASLRRTVTGFENGTSQSLSRLTDRAPAINTLCPSALLERVPDLITHLASLLRSKITDQRA